MQYPNYLTWYLDFAATLNAYSVSDISDSELAPCLPPHSSSDETSSPEEDLGPLEDTETDNTPNTRRGFRRWSRLAAVGGGCSASRDVIVFRHCKRYCIAVRRKYNINNAAGCSVHTVRVSEQVYPYIIFCNFRSSFLQKGVDWCVAPLPTHLGH